MTKNEAVDFLLLHPADFGRLVGFADLGEMHNEWIKLMVCGCDDDTLQAHRGSYKTTCVEVALAIICILFPRLHTLFIRKTDSDVKEVMATVKNILNSQVTQYFVTCIYGAALRLVVENQTEISTNLSADVKGTPQLVGMGIGSSLTGKHFDRIFTDDIVNVQDRISKAERDRTKLVYQELQNIKNRGGRIFNTGTPWHKDDAFGLMPNAQRFDCYSTGLISEDELDKIKSKMLPSLFAANYELRHISAEDVIFTSPKTGVDYSMAEQGMCHVDAAYGGEDWTAFTIVNRREGKFYVYGRCWRKGVEELEDEIIRLRAAFNAGRIFLENNGDKGFLARDLKKKGERVMDYHEDMNKFLKITTYLKFAWENVYFVQGTDEEYINQICDYTEDAEHDDCPDSLASLIRVYSRKSESEYKPLWN